MGRSCPPWARKPLEAGGFFVSLFSLTRTHAHARMLTRARTGCAPGGRGVSLIPQEPLLFSGSVRFNLDPFGLHADGKLWGMLADIGLTAVVRAEPEGLGWDVGPDGANLRCVHV